LKELVAGYSARVAARTRGGTTTKPIEMPALSVVFTMTQTYAGQPIMALRPYMEQVRDLGVPTFSQTIRDNKKLFAPAGESGVPVVISKNSNKEIVEELGRLADELAQWLGGTNHE
jgi:chromosome partitioning protein